MRRFYVEYQSHPKLRQLVAEISWGHNFLILNKVKETSPSELADKLPDPRKLEEEMKFEIGKLSE